MFKEIQGYGGGYEITDEGCIYSKKSNKILKPFLSNSGYYQINLFDRGKRTKLYIHRIVAKEYFGDSNLQVNHIDGNKLNNNPSNLEYNTGRENLLHAYRNNLRKPLMGKDNILSKEVSQFSKKGEFIKKYGSTVEAERETGIHNSSISACCRKYKNHVSAGGFIWRYI